MTDRFMTCETCRWWAPNNGNLVGFCHRYPPTIIRREALADTVFALPLMSQGDWCGEHQSSQPAIQACEQMGKRIAALETALRECVDELEIWQEENREIGLPRSSVTDDLLQTARDTLSEAEKRGLEAFLAEKHDQRLETGVSCRNCARPHG